MNNEEDHKEQLRQESLKIRENLKKIKHRIVVFSGKGGVGKTTVSINLAYAIQNLGKATGLLDADITGPNISKMTGIQAYTDPSDSHRIPRQKNFVKIVSFGSMIGEGEPVIWRGPLRSKMLNSFLADIEWGDLDYLIADMPPGTGDEIITMGQKMMPDLAVIVTTPQEVSLVDSHRAINMARKMNIPRIALVENMSGFLCPECGAKIDLFGSGGGKRQAESMYLNYLGSLPVDINARKWADEGRPFILEDPESEISGSMLKIAEKTCKLVEEDSIHEEIGA